MKYKDSIVGLIKETISASPHHTSRRTMARSTQKKKAKTGNTLQDFIFTLSTISNLYERQGDAGRAKSFEVASENLTKFAELTV